VPDYIPRMANSHVREEFSKRLKHAMTKIGIGAHGAIRLAQEFNDRHGGKEVTHQAVQKWLGGEAIPTQDKLRTLAGLLDVTIAWLRDGEGKEGAAGATHEASSGGYNVVISDQELLKRYRKLSDRQQKAVAEIITSLAAKGSRR
jgi:transcriptional regulator with XRE-family HTH domain